jgi:hypothetical protein
VAFLLLCMCVLFHHADVFFVQIQVLYFNNNYAGVVLLVGQVADGLSTTLVGLLCDGQDNTWLCRWVIPY